MGRLAQTLGVENTMTAPLTFTQKDWTDLDNLFTGGDLSACTKSELERFAVMLTRPRANERVGGTSNFAPACAAVQTLLLVRMSEEQNEQAKRESRLALIISCIALLMATIQAIVGLWPLVRSSPTLVEANKALPIFAPSPIVALPAAPTPSVPPLQAKSTEAPAPSTQTPRQSAPQSSAASSVVP